MKRKSVFIKATDDWCPNFPNDEVELSICKLTFPETLYRVSVWGADDCGMNVDIKDINEALALYNKIKSKGTVNMQYLSKLGLESF